MFLAVFSALLLGGCSTTTFENREYFKEDNRQFFESIKHHPRHKRNEYSGNGIDPVQTSSTQSAQNRDMHESHVNKVDPETTTTVGLTLRTPPSQAVEKFGKKPNSLPRVETIPESAACRYLRKSADSEAVIIGSPTASASTDEDGSGSISIGMNLLDLRKAELVRASGDAKCRLHEASRKIEATLGLGIEATRFARAHAKQNHIRKNLGYLNRVEREATRLMQQGAITVQDKNLVSQRIGELKAEMERFMAEASQRQDLPALNIQDIRHRHGALVEATSDLQNIEREIRTNDALELSISAGYRFNERFNTETRARDSEGSFARITLGVKLGALSHARHRLEEEAIGAKMDALFEENTGAIWKSGFSKAATDRMVNDLRQSETQLANAIARADDTIRRLSSAERPEVIRASLTTKVEKIRVGSNLAAVRASIKQLQQNSNNITALSQ